MRGTVNEGPVTNALSKTAGILALFECGLLSSRKYPYLAVSPDGIALLDLHKINASSFVERSTAVASVEIKTSVGEASSARRRSLSHGDWSVCAFGDRMFLEVVEKEHIAQLLHAQVVLDVQYCVYVCASENCIVSRMLVKVSQHLLDLSVLQLLSFEPILEIARSGQGSYPDDFPEEKAELLNERRTFWNVLYKHVVEKGPLIPIKIFKHSSQTLYSKTKGGVDGLTQIRNILNTPSSSLPWEQKMVI